MSSRRFSRLQLVSIGLLLIAALSIPATTSAQERLTENTLQKAIDSDPIASLDSMKWLVGRWVGTGMGGEVEETWSPARDGRMVGMFRYVRDGKTVLLELMTLSEVEGSVILRVKHFSPELVAWEEKEERTEFSWVSAGEGRIDFDGLSFRPNPAGDQMQVYLAMRRDDGSVNEVAFDFRRETLDDAAAKPQR